MKRNLLIIATLFLAFLTISCSADADKTTKISEPIIPTKDEAIKAFNEAFSLYEDPYGFVSDDEAEKIMIENTKKIVESFPSNWKCGVMVVRYQNSNGNFSCAFYPLIETQSGYFYGAYYLKGVEIKEVNFENIYPEPLFPVSMAEKNPIAIWRHTDLWNESKIWEPSYWENHGQYSDPDLEGADWLPLN